MSEYKLLQCVTNDSVGQELSLEKQRSSVIVIVHPACDRRLVTGGCASKDSLALLARPLNQQRETAMRPELRRMGYVPDIAPSSDDHASFVLHER